MQKHQQRNKALSRPERPKPNQRPFIFPPSTPFTYCRICGEYFSHASLNERKRWSHYHAAKHSQQEHRLLFLSGLHLTPTAAYKLAPLGVIPAVDMVTD